MSQSIIPDYKYIDSTESFNVLCQELQQESLIAFDSEFMRSDTFYPVPGLFQLSNGSDIYLVDPLTIDDWDMFRSLLTDNNITLVMHSCSEDLSLLQHFLGVIPTRLFDTQRAAAFLGHGYSISYQALLQVELGIEVEKTETRSDWLKRPLSTRQLNYAAIDVAHLHTLQARLASQLVAKDMLDWLRQDCDDILGQVCDESDVKRWWNAYQNISGAWKLSSSRLRLLQKLCYWREATARKRDKPRNWIAKDSMLLELSARLEIPNDTGTMVYSTKHLVATGAMTDRQLRTDASGIVDQLNDVHVGGAVADSDSIDTPLSVNDRRRLKDCQRMANRKAEELGIAPELLARKRQWLQLFANVKHSLADVWPEDMDNWRKQLLEPETRRILDNGGESNSNKESVVNG